MKSNQKSQESGQRTPSSENIGKNGISMDPPSGLQMKQETAQKAPEEEEQMQGKDIQLQAEEEETPAQGKNIQLQEEEEEPAQGKEIQMQEEEEEAQAKKE
ncbi:MAG: hypothetical protein C0599_17970 [Salinivirgaceae bacterium]|nr:MAG: hypothetical protein C0599_17970 [Salinivirgaceae bacterium]